MAKSACYVNHSNDVELARRNVEKQNLEDRKIEMEARKIEKEGRKMGDLEEVNLSEA